MRTSRKRQLAVLIAEFLEHHHKAEFEAEQAIRLAIKIETIVHANPSAEDDQMADKLAELMKFSRLL